MGTMTERRGPNRRYRVIPEIEFEVTVRGYYALLQAASINPTIGAIEKFLKQEGIAVGNYPLSEIFRDIKYEPDEGYPNELLARQRAAGRRESEPVYSSPMGNLGEGGGTGRSSHRTTDSDGEYKP